jgi:hypothetical protein
VFAVLSVLPLSAAPQSPASQPPGSGRQAATAQAAAQADHHREEGRPLIRAYQPLEIGGGGQTWSIVQDRRGVMYLGINGAVLEFDGASWRRIPIGTIGVAARGLALDDTGRIWVGSVGSFGYLAPDASGTLQYVSLADRLPADAPQFADVWRVMVTPDGVVFQTSRAIFRWAHDRITIIKAASRFGRASEVDGRVYVATPEGGLNVLDDSTLRPLPGTGPIGNEAFPIVLRYDERHLLVGTRQDGLFLYDGTALTPFRTDADVIFKTTQMYRGIALPGPRFGIATTGAGLITLDPSGHLVSRVHRPNGLPSDVVYYAMRDREGALWIGLDNGVARVETPSPVSHFNQADGLSGLVTAATRLNARLYLGLQSGAAFLVPASPDGVTPAHFERIAGAGNQCWAFLTMVDPAAPGRSATPLACGDGLYEIQNSRAIPIKETKDLSFRPNCLVHSRADPTRLWVGLFDGLASFRWVNGRWLDEGRIEDVNDEVRYLFEDADGSVWAGTAGTGALHVVMASKPGREVERPATRIERFGTNEGLPAGGTSITDVKGVPLFQGGLENPRVFRYNAGARRFDHDTAFDNVVGLNSNIDGGFFVSDAEGRVFLNRGRETVMMQQRGNGTWSVDPSMFARFGSTPASGFFADGGVAWLQLVDGRLMRYDMSQRMDTPAAWQVLIRRITGSRERLLYTGDRAMPAETRLDAASNGLRFEFALPTYFDESATQYQSRLDGFDTDWSAWTHEAQREYTNLGFGDYRFRVRGRGISGSVSTEAAYAFTILPPWYRTWGAYAMYVLGALLVMFESGRFIRRRVVAKERERAQFTEAKLRADAAEALAQAESERKKNVELLSEMGREITASLDFETIFGKLYEKVNELADADVFGVGLYHPERHEIEYRLAIEKGKRYAPYTRDTRDPNQLPVWCVEHREAVYINDLPNEYSRYIPTYKATSVPLEDGSMSEEPQSLIYLPLIAKDRALGIITIQSFEKFAYTEHHLNVLRSLASYTAIALDNADAYKQLNEHEHEIRRLFEEAEKARGIAEEADAAKSAFLSTVSHELRTPLTSVLGFAKIIKKRLEDRIFPLVQSDEPKVRQTIQPPLRRRCSSTRGSSW